LGCTFGTHKYQSPVLADQPRHKADGQPKLAQVKEHVGNRDLAAVTQSIYVYKL
jgi:hypothetical protein